MKHLFLKSNSQDPYAVLDDFFGREDMAYYCKVLQGALSHIHLPKVYLDVTPSSLMATLNDIAELIDAAFVIFNDFRRGEVIQDSADIPKKDALFTTFDCNSFSGFLSEKEFKKPYKVLKKFFLIQTAEQ